MISAEPHTTLVEWVQFCPYFVPRETVSPCITFIPSLYTPCIVGESLFHLSRKGFWLISPKTPLSCLILDK
nr:MAG TPA: hypothetical protein [Microviridae sp.]